MTDPTREQLVQLGRNMIELENKLDRKGIQNLIERFDVVGFIAEIDQPKLEAIRCLAGFKPVITEPVCSWLERDRVIYCSVTSDGTIGEAWISRFESKGYHLSNYAKVTLRSNDFKPTNGVTTDIAILKGTLLKDSDRITKKIRVAAYKGTFTQGQKLLDPNAEVTCLIREKFTDKEIEAMGLWWIVAMHEPIVSDGYPYLLGAYRSGDGPWLDAYCAYPDYGWVRRHGFVFAVSQVSS